MKSFATRMNLKNRDAFNFFKVFYKLFKCDLKIIKYNEKVFVETLHLVQFFKRAIICFLKFKNKNVGLHQGCKIKTIKKKNVLNVSLPRLKHFFCCFKRFFFEKYTIYTICILLWWIKIKTFVFVLCYFHT